MQSRFSSTSQNLWEVVIQSTLMNCLHTNKQSELFILHTCFFVVVFVVVFLVFSPPNLKPEQSNDVILESQGKQLVQIITDLQSGMDLCSNASCWSLLPSHGCIGGCCQQGLCLFRCGVLEGRFSALICGYKQWTSLLEL